MSSRLPNLERALLNAALELDAHGEPVVVAPPSRRWWRRRRSTPLLATIATLLVAGGAVAGSGLLDRGDSVPASGHLERWLGAIEPGSSLVLSLRAPDPDSGPPWAVGVFRISRGDLVCLRAARVQGTSLGVVGRDGAFHNDGRFHPLPAAADQIASCGGGGAHAAKQISFLMTPPIPASGSTGAQQPPVGGCLDEPLSPATTSKQTRRKLRGVPVCARHSMRVVKYGLAGSDAVSVRYANDKVSRTITPSTDGAYLFVFRADDVGPTPFTLTITYRDGSVCALSDMHPALSPGCS